MACEITAVNDDLDDATIAFIENMLLFLMKKIHFFWQTFGYLVASEKRIPSTKLLQRISLSILRSAGAINLCAAKACAIDSIHLWCHHFQFGVFQQARYCIAISMATPFPPTCGFGEPVHCFAAIRPVSKVTEHCQTASRKSDRTLHRPLSCPASAWRWYESATTRWYMGTRMPNAQEVPM
ncbi:hypothetical protein PAPYR_7025 [Paratrimastix pyriformis]|uniref:Uncharacterized protein n=1 Tax=Paratrimastix pyriformis TaxID=342808 RepID=A0ABQ8UHS2_9EUKA|nr:hypothetical protein PAPYR_7025 [Paratrimastix pyriformis]